MKNPESLLWGIFARTHDGRVPEARRDEDKFQELKFLRTNRGNRAREEEGILQLEYISFILHLLGSHLQSGPEVGGN